MFPIMLLGFKIDKFVARDVSKFVSHLRTFAFSSRFEAVALILERDQC